MVIRPTKMAVGLMISLLVGGCGAPGSVDPGANASAPQESDPGVAFTGTSDLAPPYTGCGAEIDLTQAKTLVQSGSVSSVAIVTISKPATPRAKAGNTTFLLTPLDQVSLVAGKFINGNPDQLETSDVTSTAKPQYPAGKYLLLLSAADGYPSGRYYVGNGIAGSFVIDGQTATQRCPNYSDPDHPLENFQSSLDDLETTFVSALS